MIAGLSKHTKGYLRFTEVSEYDTGSFIVKAFGVFP